MQIPAISIDLVWLAIAGLCMSLLWIPHIVRIWMQVGWRASLWNPQHEIEPVSHWAGRAKRAQRNAARHFAIFAVLVLIAHLGGADPAPLGQLVALWLGTRLGHFVSYMAGIPTLPQIFFVTNICIALWLSAQLVFSGG